jgi:four helix bundle protein
MAKVNTYRDLLIWQKSMILITDIYKITTNFPINEQYGLTSQIRRSAISIASNIAEGFGRNSKLEFNRFLNISMGSLFEIQTQLEISKNLKYIEDDIFKEIFERSREIERMISSFKSKLKE